MFRTKKLEFWIDNYCSRDVFEKGIVREYQFVMFALENMKLYDNYILKYLGSIEVEPTWDEEFQEYIYGSKAVDKALEKRGIDPWSGELPCLEEGECRGFKKPKELIEFLKERIDSYKPSKDKNELIEYIDFLKKHCNSFSFINCNEIKIKKFSNDNERKEFLKKMIDDYVKNM